MPRLLACIPCGDTDLEYFHDLFHRRAELQGRLDVPACSGRVHVRDRRIDGDAQQLRQLGREYAAGVNREARGDDRFGPRRVHLEEPVPGRIPLARGFHPVADRRRRRCLRRRLHPGGLRFFQQNGRAEAGTYGSTAETRSSGPSGSLRGSRRLRVRRECGGGFPGAQVRTRRIHRKADQLDVFARQYAAGPRVVGHLEALVDPDGSHSRNVASAGSSQGPVASALSGTAISLSPSLAGWDNECTPARPAQRRATGPVLESEDGTLTFTSSPAPAAASCSTPSDASRRSGAGRSSCRRSPRP